MNPIVSAFRAAAAVASLASTAYYCYTDHVREAETRSLEVSENQSLDVGFLLNKIPVFDGSGYGIWSSMMRSLFLSQDLWDMVEGGYIEEELSVEVLREVRKKDAWALLCIQQTIDASVFSCIAGAKKSKEAWDALQNKFQGDDNPVDKSVLSCPADATQCKEAWDALGMESQEPNQNKAVDESVLSCAADTTESKEAAWDALEQGYRANTKVMAQPEVGNPCSGKIIISRLDKAIDEEALRAKFSAFGNLVSCKVARDASGQSKGKAYMEYDSEEAAQKAIRKVNGRLLNDKKVYVGPVVSKQEGEKVMEMTKFTNVYVGNLSESTTEEDLRKVFDYFGTIVRILVMRDGDGKSKGFGFVNFKDADDAAWCMQVLNGHKFDNKVWCVRRANQKKLVGRTQKKSVDEYVPSSTESKKSGDSVPQKKFNGKAAKKKCLDESVPSSSNATESKKAGEAVQKGNRAKTRVLYVDNKGVAHFKLKSP